MVYDSLDTERMLQERGEAYGAFKDVSARFIDIVRASLGGVHPDKLTPSQRTAIYMIAMKMARIVEGNPAHADSWADIRGYAALVEMEINNAMHDTGEIK